MAVSASFLRKQGATSTEAALAVTLRFVFAFVVQVLVLVVFVVLLSGARGAHQFEAPKVSGLTVAIVVGVVVLAAAISFAFSKVRHVVAGQLRDAFGALRELMRRPRGALLLAAGSFGLLTMYTAAFALSLYAFRAQLPLLAAITIYLGGSALGQLVPTPGGVGGIEALLITGLTRGGVDSGTSVAAVLTFRMLTYWLPIVPGWLAYRSLQRSGRV